MRRGQRGFTLVEVMVSIAIFTIVSLAMAGTFLVGYRAISNEARVIAADTAVSDASLSLIRDLNSATPPPSGTIDSSSSVTLTYGSPQVSVRYSLDANRNLIRTVNGGPNQAAARGITRGPIRGTKGSRSCAGTPTEAASTAAAPAATPPANSSLPAAPS